MRPGANTLRHTKGQVDDYTGFLVENFGAYLHAEFAAASAARALPKPGSVASSPGAVSGIVTFCASIARAKSWACVQ